MATGVEIPQVEPAAPKALWITWERQVRNRSLATALAVPLVEVRCSGGRLRRYLSCGLQTLITVVRIRPVVIFAQNPSLFLNYLILALRTVFRYRIICDAHYAGVEHLAANRCIQYLLDWLNRRVDCVIVTNSNHASHVSRVGGQPFVCPDPIPDLSPYRPLDVPKKSVLVICSFDPDEPLDAILKAGERLRRDGFCLLVSGNPAKAKLDPAAYPQVQFLGYLSEPDYYGTLLAVDVVLDLTNLDDCLVCGGYEAMSAEVPLVTSDKAALRAHFTAGTLFVSNSPEDIARGVMTAARRRAELVQEIKSWKRKDECELRSRIEQLRRIAGLLPSRYDSWPLTEKSGSKEDSAAVLSQPPRA